MVLGGAIWAVFRLHTRGRVGTTSTAVHAAGLAADGRTHIYGRGFFDNRVFQECES